MTTSGGILLIVGEAATAEGIAIAGGAATAEGIAIAGGAATGAVVFIIEGVATPVRGAAVSDKRLWHADFKRSSVDDCFATLTDKEGTTWPAPTGATWTAPEGAGTGVVVVAGIVPTIFLTIILEFASPLKALMANVTSISLFCMSP